MKADIGVFGGTGFFSFLENVEQIDVETSFGATSDRISVGEYKGKKIAFLPRHRHDYSIPPHMINFRANIYAMKSLGVKKIISPCSCGSLQLGIKPGDLVIPDQFIDRTKGRKDTFYDGPKITFVSGAEPYCSSLREIAIECGRKLKLPIHERGTVVVIQGPHFSTKAESCWFSKMGWSVVNMTQYPEVILAREQEICFCGIALVTDYDAGLQGHPEIKSVEAKDFMKVFNANIETVKKLLLEIIEKTDVEKECSCNAALKNATL
ncbi:S-methyl-5'-thioadenosine phosphorylase [Candidatus Micrarchaeota archaeon]|nr:S-methyl-5'-thioadenosine phosphorylase [Candidatus Micrarchaeota archaeon]